MPSAPHVRPDFWRLGWFGVWLAFLAYPISDIFARHHPLTWLVAAWAALVVFVALYLRTIWAAVVTDPRSRGPISPSWLAALVVISLASVTAFGPAWDGLVIYVGVATGWTMAVGPAVVTLAVLDAYTIIYASTHHLQLSDGAFLVFLSSALGVSMLGVRRLVQLIGELEEARDQAARLTMAEQRLAFARDLHDVLGRNLSVIALQSEVVRRTMTRDPAAAAAAISDVEAVARQSLTDVRELVSGYRQRSLAEELANAAELFMAAGIDASINRPVLLPVGEAGPLLAWAVREGATNVIRHSRAARCVITVASGDGEARLDIADDGVGCGAAARGSTSSAVATAAGAGLQGLRERLSSAGGRIEAGPRPEGGFRLSVILPMAPAPA